MYVIIKHLHILTAVITGLGLLIRGVLVQINHPVMDRKWIRIAPHINDTLLLITAIWLAWTLGMTPWNSPWILAKITALLAYIGFGTFALKRARTQSIRLTCLILAMLTYGYIILVARSHSPWPF